ncbi:MAG: molybdopterin-dependent oxidoreductase [Burkholderiaceae bacterium]|nr:molybdopterin-dependent oxidoreductase [Burkholderiaceae bacterium]
MLTLTGRIAKRNAGDTAVFDMAMLEALPQREIVAPTPWFDEPRRFTGPLLRDVLAAGGATGTTLKASALNNYRVEIPFDDAVRHDVVLARLLDGKPMSVREKGPLFVMYPFDRKSELRNAVYYSRCIWQLRAIEVR